MVEVCCQRGDICKGRGGDLDAHKTLVKQLYVEDELALSKVISTLKEEHGINASASMYKKKLRQWQISKAGNATQAQEVAHSSLASLNTHGSAESNRAFPLRWRWVQPVKSDGMSAPSSLQLRQTAIPPDDSPTATSPTTPYTVSRNWSGDGSERFITYSQNDQSPTSSPSSSHRKASISSSVEDVSNASEASTQLNRSQERSLVQLSTFSLAHSHLSHRLQSQTLRQLPVPLPLKLIEEIVHAVRTHVARRVEPRLFRESSDSANCTSTPGDLINQRRRLPVPPSFDAFASALREGCDEMSKTCPQRMISSFESAFHQLEPMILSDHFSISCVTIMAVRTLQVNGHHEVGRMLVRQVSRIASTIHGPSHPHAVWTRNFYQIFDNRDAVIAIMQATADGMESVLGPEDVYSVTMQSQADQILLQLRPHNSRQQILSRFLGNKSLLDRHFTYPYNLRYYLILCRDFASALYTTQAYEAAESILMDVPAQLDRYLDDLAAAKVAACRAAPILESMILLGRVLFARGKPDDAHRVWTRTANVSRQILGPDSPVTQDASAYLGLNFVPPQEGD